MTVLLSFFSHTDAGPDLPYLERVFDKYSMNGPDGTATHLDKSFWVGQHLLRTTALCQTIAGVSKNDTAGVSLVSVGRVDDRPSLLSQFPESERQRLMRTSHQELFLECYLKWGLDWLTHVTGEFCGIIHDKRFDRMVLFTDRFGSKPLYYFYKDGVLLASTNLSILVANKNIPIDINETAIARFLLFGIHDFNDDTITPYRYIQKVPKASQKIFENAKTRQQCYWDILSVQSAYTPRKAAEVRDVFVEQMGLALQDRVSHQSTGLLLSGGLDSTLLATLLTSNDINVPHLKVYTGLTHEHDEERKYVELTKAKLAISDHSWIVSSASEPLLGFKPTAVPSQLLFPIEVRNFVDAFASENCRVMLRGTGADELLHDEGWAASDGFKELGPLRGIQCFWQCLMELPSMPPLGIRKLMRAQHACKQAGITSNHHLFPSWISNTLAQSVNLHDIWHDAFAQKATETRTFARTCLARASWNQASFMPDPMKQMFHYSDPFLDRRIVEFLLSIYPLPWARKKHLLRSVLSNRLPCPLTDRPKTPAGNLMKWVSDFSWWGRRLEECRDSDVVSRYVNLSRVPDYSVSLNRGSLYVDIRPFILALWMQGVPKLRCY